MGDREKESRKEKKENSTRSGNSVLLPTSDCTSVIIALQWPHSAIGQQRTTDF